jgi:hypothetical protein
MPVWRFAILLAVASLVAGCDSFHVLSPERSGVLLKKIQLGMSEAEVIDELGAPQRREVHGATALLFYRTAWQLAEEAKWRSPIAIRDGKVVGFGQPFSEDPDRPAAEAALPDNAWLIEVSPAER